MNYSNIRIIESPVDSSLGWTTINQDPGSIRVQSNTPSWWNQVPGNPWGQGPSMSPSFPPTGPSTPTQGGAPTTPPPNFTPTKSSVSTFAIDPGGIRNCLHRFVFIWPSGSNRGFWIFLTFVGPRSIAGFRWNGWRWSYFGMDLNRIDSFQCH